MHSPVMEVEYAIEEDEDEIFRKVKALNMTM
jgi:hypothetical protein